MKSKSIDVRFPEAVLAAINSNVGASGRSEFLREAAVEKLYRDFGVGFTEDVVKLMRGKRHDLVNPTDEKRAQMAEHAARMREAKARKAKGLS